MKYSYLKYHSLSEKRFIAMGIEQHSRRTLFVAFTIRFMNKSILIRPISARYMHAKEVKAHEEQIKKLKIS